MNEPHEEQNLMTKMEQYKKIVLARTEGKTLSKKGLLLLSLMISELGGLSTAMVNKNRGGIGERLNNLMICGLCMASLFNIKIHAYPEDPS